MKDPGLKTGRLFGVFLLGCVLFNYPIISLFDTDSICLRLPLFYMYLFMAWGLLILLLLLITRAHSKPQEKKDYK